MRRAASPRAVWLFTVPVLHPSSCAVASTDWSSQYRSTTAARCPGGSAARALRRSTVSPTSWAGVPCSGTSGSAVSRLRKPRLDSSIALRTSTCRA